MAQWVNHLQNNIYINSPPLTLSCEISGALHLAQPGLTAGKRMGGRVGGQAGRQAGRLAGWLASRQESRRNSGKFPKFQNSLQIDICNVLLRLTSVQHHYNSTNAFQ